jgi:hypothetical protein
VVTLISVINLFIDPLWGALFPKSGNIPRALFSGPFVCIALSMNTLAIAAAAIFGLGPIRPIRIVLDAAGIPVQINGGVSGYMLALNSSFLIILAMASLCYLLFFDLFVKSTPDLDNAIELNHIPRYWEDSRHDSAIDIPGPLVIEFEEEQVLGLAPHVVRVFDGIAYLLPVTNGTADGLDGQYRANEAYHAQRAVELSVEKGDVVQIIMRDQGSGAVLARHEANSTIGFIDKSILTRIHTLKDPFDDSFSTTKTH